MRWPGVEPGSTAWKAIMLTITPPTLALHHTAMHCTALVSVCNSTDKHMHIYIGQTDTSAVQCIAVHCSVMKSKRWWCNG